MIVPPVLMAGVLTLTRDDTGSTLWIRADRVVAVTSVSSPDGSDLTAVDTGNGAPWVVRGHVLAIVACLWRMS